MIGLGIYRLYRFVYVTVWFYFLPFIATIVQYYFVSQSVYGVRVLLNTRLD